MKYLLGRYKRCDTKVEILLYINGTISKSSMKISSAIKTQIYRCEQMKRQKCISPYYVWHDLDIDFYCKLF